MNKDQRKRLRELHDQGRLCDQKMTCVIAVGRLLDALDDADAAYLLLAETAHKSGVNNHEEKTRLRARIAELEAKRLDVHCAFCGEHMVNISEETANLRMAEHIVTCEKHPLRAAANRVAELEEGKKNLRYTNKQLLATLAEAEARLENAEAAALNNYEQCCLAMGREGKLEAKLAAAEASVLCECGHTKGCHEGHTHLVGTPEPSHCSQACGCEAFRCGAERRTAEAIVKRLREETSRHLERCGVHGTYDHAGDIIEREFLKME